ncbi:TlpA family protein disulfide reductase [Wukongibacter sp. M2B1]|uniref:TlpA family protein disulfide reductase n=1 Tax=Wukongibacter sp. M2B1 TaxID=3088895 RepID=UPI003D78EFDE
MLKKLITVMLCIFLFIGLTACGKTEEPEVKPDEETNIEENAQENTEESIGEDDSFEKNPVAGKVIGEFSAEDLDGNTVTNKVFEENDLTVLNIWGTFCGPCIEEIPELEEIQNHFKDKKVKVIGLVIDKEKEEAINIMKQVEAKYTNIIPDSVLDKDIVTSFEYVPATIFINSEGEVLKTFIAGSSEFEVFKGTIEEILAGDKE